MPASTVHAEPSGHDASLWVSGPRSGTVGHQLSGNRGRISTITYGCCCRCCCDDADVNDGEDDDEDDDEDDHDDDDDDDSQ